MLLSSISIWFISVFTPLLLHHSRAHQSPGVQESVNNIVCTGSVIVKVDAMSTVRLNDRREVAGSNVREIHLDHRGNRLCNATSGEAVASAVWEIGICAPVSTNLLCIKRKNGYWPPAINMTGPAKLFIIGSDARVSSSPSVTGCFVLSANSKMAGS